MIGWDIEIPYQQGYWDYIEGYSIPPYPSQARHAIEHFWLRLSRANWQNGYFDAWRKENEITPRTL